MGDFLYAYEIGCPPVSLGMDDIRRGRVQMAVLHWLDIHVLSIKVSAAGKYFPSVSRLW